MHRITVGGGVMGVLFAVGNALIFLLGLPASRWFLLASLFVGVCVAALLYVWHGRHPVKLTDLRQLSPPNKAAMDKKLRLNRDECSLVGPDGKVIRELLPSEMAGIILYDTFHPGYADDHVEEMIYDEQEVERRRAWIRGQEKEEEHFIAWWKSATYEQRLVVVKRWYDILLPHIRAERAPAEDVASIADISSDWHLVGVLTQSEARSRGAEQEEKKK
jgi:hypothetical protein